MEYLIRDFHEDDIHDLIRLCAKHAVHEQCEYDATGKSDLLRDALLSTSPSITCWIVEIKNIVVGYATFTFDFSTWSAHRFLHLDCIYLEESCRGFGIGESIMKKIIEVAKAEDCVNVQWQTPVFNEKAIRFYKRLGATGLSKKRFSIDVS